MMEQILEYLSHILEQGTIFGPLIALFAGVLTSMMPCSLPMLPIIIGYLSSQKSDTKTSFKIALIYSAGIITTLVILSMIAVALGRIFNQQSRLFQLIIGILLILMAIQTSGYYQFISPKYVKSNNKSLFGVYITGVLMGVFSSPCTTPVIITLMGVASTLDSLLKSVLLFLLYGIGNCFLIIIASISVGKINTVIESDRYLKYSIWIQRILAIFIGLLGIYFIVQAV